MPLRLKPSVVLYAFSILLYVPNSAATTVILAVTRSGTVIGVDAKINVVCTEPGAPCVDNSAPIPKLLIVEKRFAVAAIGLLRANIMAADRQPVFVYDFPTWLEQIEDRLFPDATMFELCGIVRDEYKKPLLGLERAIREGIITHEDPNLTPRYIIVGYQSGVANVYSIKADVDFGRHLLRDPVVRHLFPVQGERVDYGLTILGHRSALNNLCDPASASNRQIAPRFHKLAQFCSGYDLSLPEARDLIVQLLVVQAEHDRDGLPPLYRVITIKKPEKHW